MILMIKNTKVLETNKDGSIMIYEEKLLPFSLQKEDLTYEDFFFNWLSVRPLSIGRTNAKAILNNAGIPQNSLTIARICHGMNLSDCYWVKEREEDTSWDKDNLYDHDMDPLYADTALTGKSHHLSKDKFHTPELTAQGVSAKCWIKENDGIYLYKVGRKELPASEILDVLGIDHVHYEKAEQLKEYLSKDRIKKIEDVGEIIVRSKLITNQQQGIIPFEEFAVWCANQEIDDEYEEAKRRDEKSYYEMQIADYILNNSDRHVGNWGFYFDVEENKLQGMYPLMDHDHSFDEEETLMSQTNEGKTLLEAARIAQAQLNLPVKDILEIPKPEYLMDNEWEQVRKRVMML
ncbi:Phosphatidylinositol 3-and 4-kinase [uncultured Eubacterium sp.]|nr:Phosphatidylinositol 3-and 4-kinase [uncultured Eubacterium sp.]